jgi:large subunit ribosomal protein L26e
MSAALSKDLKEKYHVNAMPVRKDDEVLVTRGHFKGQQGKITACYRRKWVIHIERLQKEKANGATVPVGFDPSKVEIVKLKIDKDRKAILARKDMEKKDAKSEGKHEVSTA